MRILVTMINKPKKNTITERIHPDFHALICDLKKDTEEKHSIRLENPVITKIIAETYNRDDFDLFYHMKKKGRGGLKLFK